MPTLAVGIDARKATVGANEAKRAINKVRKETALLDTAQKKLALQMKATGKSAAMAGLGMRGMFAGMTAAVAVGKMVQSWSRFDTSLRRIQGVLGGGDGVISQMKALESTARQLGATTSFTAAEAADGMLMLSRAGMSAGEVVAATGAVLDLAKVAAIGLQEAATLTADSLKQFSMDASDARKAADTLAFAANNSNTDITQLGEGLKLAGPIAAAAGMSLQDTSVALGILADNGLKATLGGTGIRAMLASLGDPSTEAAAALERLGIDVEALGETIQKQGGLAEIMGQLGPDVMGMTDAIRIFSRRGAAAALIMAKSTKRWREFDKAIKGSDGTVRNSAELIEKGLGDSFKQLGSAIAEASLALGDSGLSDALKSVVHWLTEGVRALSDWSVEMSKAGASAALLIVSLGAGGLMSVVAALVTKFKAAKAAAGGFMALLSKHPIMMAITAFVSLGSAMIAFSSDASFASQELVDMDRTIRGMTESLDSLAVSWQHATEFGQLEKQIQTLSGMRGMVDKLAEAQFALPKGAKIPAQTFDSMRDALAQMGVYGFFTHTGDTPQAPPAASMQAVQKTWLRETGSKERRVLGRADFVTERGDPRGEVTREQALEQAKRVLGLLGDQIDELREKTKRSTQQLVEETDKKANQLTTMDKLRSMHVALTEELNIERLALQKGQHVRDAWIDQLSVLDTLVKETGLTRQELIKQYGAELGVLQKVLEEKHKVMKRDQDELRRKEQQAQFADTLASAVVNPLIDGLMSGDFREVGRSMYMQLVGAILEEMVAKPAIKAIASALTTAAAADGMALSGGVQRFARGGVVTQATAFGMAGNRTGVMGEAGPEAIMPLKRLSNGQLGVTAQGSGTTVNDNRTINIQVHDDAGFRRTMRQLDRDQARRLDKGTK